MQVAGSLNFKETFAVEEEVVEEEVAVEVTGEVSPLPQPTTIAPVTANATSTNERTTGKRNSFFEIQLACLLSVDIGPFDLVFSVKVPYQEFASSCLRHLYARFCTFS